MSESVGFCILDQLAPGDVSFLGTDWNALHSLFAFTKADESVGVYSNCIFKKKKNRSKGIAVKTTWHRCESRVMGTAIELNVINIKARIVRLVLWGKKCHVVHQNVTNTVRRRLNRFTTRQVFQSKRFVLHLSAQLLNVNRRGNR